jgi:hypothetical protein
MFSGWRVWLSTSMVTLEDCSSIPEAMPPAAE